MLILLLPPPSGTQNEPAGQATEVDVARSVTRSKVRSVGQAVEADSSRSVARIKTRGAGQATESDVARSVVKAGPQSRPVGQAVEADTSRSVAKPRTKTLGRPVETDASLSVARTKARAAGTATESDVARSVARTKVRAVGRPAEADSAFAIDAGGAQIVPLGRPTESGVARTVTAAPGTAREAVFPATETGVAHAVAPARLRALGRATEGSSARPIGRPLVRPVARSTELSSARPFVVKFPGSLGVATESDLAGSILAWKLVSIGRAELGDAGRTCVTSGRGTPVSIGSSRSRPVAGTLHRVDPVRVGRRN